METGQKLIEIAAVSPSNRNVIIPLDQLFRYVDDRPLYRSIYSYDKEILDHMSIRKTVRNYRGKFYLDQIYFDIDKGVNSDQAVLDHAKYFIDELDLPQEYVQIWFSGTGYHIVVPDLFNITPSNELPAIVKASLKEMFDSIDTSIYMATGMIRVGRTINTKSNLYKIPLSLSELMNESVEWIHEQAKTPRLDFRHEPFDEIEPIWSDKVVKTGNDAPLKRVEAQDTTPYVTCVQKMFNEGPIQGSRHTKIIRMASSWKRVGIPLQAAIDSLSKWANTLNDYEIKHQVEDIYSKGYRFGCQDHMLSKYCDPKCLFYKSKNYTLELVTADQAEKNFIKFIRSDFSDKAFNFRDYYSQMNHDFYIYPGELVIVSGDTGLGKSTWLQNIIAQVNHMKVLFLPLENAEKLTFRRFAQITSSMTKEEVIEYYKHNSNGLSQKFEHVTLLPLPPRIDGVNQLVAEFQPNILVVDTIDELVSDKNDFDAQKERISWLKQIANKHDIIVFGVHHVAKADAKTGNFTIHSLKGLSDHYQKADKVLMIEGNMDYEDRSVRSLKARDEQPMALGFRYDKERAQFIEKV